MKTKRTCISSLLIGMLVFAGCGGAGPEEHTASRSFAQTVNFPDITNHWAKDFIVALAQRNIINGYPDGTFKPDRDLTRAEFAALIYAAFDPAPQGPPVYFKDLNSNHWAYHAIQAVARAGFMTGFPNKLFRPERKLTRAEMFVTLVNGLKIQSPELPMAPLIFFEDSHYIPGWATSEISKATTANLVVNYPNIQRLRPNAMATRAEVSTAIYQALVYINEAQQIDSEYIVTLLIL